MNLNDSPHPGLGCSVGLSVQLSLYNFQESTNNPQAAVNILHWFYIMNIAVGCYL